ncbi:MAG: HD domain-containing protein [Deltaproteobacteria bacterium]|nr:HD domain-containing protein [Deltaproteobacteria bacterium]
MLSESQILMGTDDGGLFFETSLIDNFSAEAIAYYKKFIEKAAEIKERIINDQGISPSPILSILHEVINKNLIDELYDYSMSVPGHLDEMVIHAVDVTFTALKIGKGMDYDTKMLLRLGLAGFLENVGMYRIPDNILKKEGKLTKDEVLVIKGHPEIGSEMLGRMGERYQWLANVALQIHERSDGSGYPRGLKGPEITELASIIGLVDVYVAMIKKRPYRDKFVQTDAIKSIIEASRGLFPQRIVKVFLNQISLFPVNSYVRLNNRSIGRVISTNPDQPLRPTIECIYDGSGRYLKERQVISLSDNPLLYIEGSVNENELS